MLVTPNMILCHIDISSFSDGYEILHMHTSTVNPALWLHVTKVSSVVYCELRIRNYNFLGTKVANQM